MNNGLNNTLVIAAVITLTGILCLIGGTSTNTPTANLIGVIATLIGLAVGTGELISLARAKRDRQSSSS